MILKRNMNGQGGAESTGRTTSLPLDNCLDKEKATMTRKVRLPAIPTEDQEQIMLVTWLQKQGIRHYAIGNGGSRNLLEAMKLKRMGLSPGVPDLCIPIPSGPWHGLYIELKRTQGGRMSPAQSEWLAFLTEKGYYAQVANGFDEAREMVNHYLALTPKAA